MSLSKIAFGLLILSQAGLAFANQGILSGTIMNIPGGHTTEYTMLQHVLALQGADLSATQMQAQITSTIGQYESTANPQGQAERLKQAMVDLKVYTPAQADSFMTDAQTYSNELQSATSTEERQQALSSVANQISQLHPAAAQFSSCVAGYSTAAFLSVGAAIGGAVMQNDETMTAGMVLSFVFIVAAIEAC